MGLHLCNFKTADFMVVQQTADERMPENAVGVSGMTKAALKRPWISAKRFPG
jgi:hypothetical protein